MPTFRSPFETKKSAPAQNPSSSRLAFDIYSNDKQSTTHLGNEEAMPALDWTNPYETPEPGSPEAEAIKDRDSPLSRARRYRLHNQSPMTPDEWAEDMPSLGETLFPDMARAGRRVAQAPRSNRPEATVRADPSTMPRTPRPTSSTSPRIAAEPDQPTMSRSSTFQAATIGTLRQDQTPAVAGTVRSTAGHPVPSAPTTGTSIPTMGTDAAGPAISSQSEATRPVSTHPVADAKPADRGARGEKGPQKQAAGSIALPPSDNQNGAPSRSTIQYSNEFDYWGVETVPEILDRPDFLLDMSIRMATIGSSPNWTPIVDDAESRTNQSLNAAERRALAFFVAAIDRFEAAGDHQAAENLRRYLGGSEEPLRIPAEFMGPGSQIRNGINVNLNRLFRETAIGNMESRIDIRHELRTLQNGKRFSFVDVWNNDYRENAALAAGNTDEHNAFGAGGVDSHYQATATRQGNTIIISGTITHAPDPNDMSYDWRNTLGMANTLEQSGIAAPFDMVFFEAGSFQIIVDVTPGSPENTLVVRSHQYFPVSGY